MPETRKQQYAIDEKIAVMCAHCGWLYQSNDARVQAEMCASSHAEKTYRYAAELPLGAMLAVGYTGSEKVQ